MANEIQDAPNTTLATNDDWENELNLRELSMKGYDGISLTEWEDANTDKPEIAAGSVIEIDGAIAKFTAQTALTDEGGLADGWCYIKFAVSGSDVVPTLTNTFGTWDTAKQGFYDSGDRYSLHVMYRSGAVTKIFTEKTLIPVDNAILGYRYYNKEYTGTTTNSGNYGAEFTDTTFLTTQVSNLPPAMINISGSIWITNSIISGVTTQFFTQLNNSLTVSYISANNYSGYGNKPFKVTLTYKIDL